MAKLTDAFIDEVLARTEIVDIISARVPLKRQGKEFAACCPFHNERSASFFVSPTKQFYHCFGCGAHGNAIRFLMTYDHVEFMDAIEELAQRAGLPLPKQHSAALVQNNHRDLYRITEEAQQWFSQQLAQNPTARRYLLDRHVNAQTAAQFKLGYAPNSFTSLILFFKGNLPQSQEQLTQCGLCSRNNQGQLYDKFRHRIIFPILDRRGRVVAFGGRRLGDGDDPKYLNSPETPLFHKGRELYGLWHARAANPQLERLIVVEGYMDVIALHQAGITQAVATLGTATTSHHAELLFRNAADVYFCFDGDHAGRHAAWRALESVLPQLRDGRQAFFLFLPDGEDPDTIIHQEGQTGFLARLAAAKPLSEFFFAQLAPQSNLDTLDGQARLAERARPYLAQLPDGAFADLMRQRLHQLTGLQTTPNQPHASPGKRAAKDQVNHQRSLIRHILTLVLQDPSLVLELSNIPKITSVFLPGIDLLFDIIKIIQQRPDITTGTLLDLFIEHPAYQALTQLATLDIPGDTASWSQELRDAFAQLTRQYNRHRLRELQIKQYEQSLDRIDKFELLQLIKSLAADP